jgi:glycosyltransferase involved in cell wall biosynthesis
MPDPTRTIAVIPAYQEATKVAQVVRDTLPYVDDVIVVDDGSVDGTGDIAATAGARVVRHLENLGAGAATMTGIEAARRLGATIVVTLDADGQHDPQDLPMLLAPVRNDTADLSLANRFGQRNHIPAIRRLFNALGNVITLLATGRWVQDSQCGLKAFGPKALAQVDLRMNGFEFCTEIIRESVQWKWRVIEVPARVVYSDYTLAKGQSFGNGILTALRIILRTFLR